MPRKRSRDTAAPAAAPAGNPAGPAQPARPIPAHRFGLRVRELRKQRGWSEVRLAEESSLTPGTVSRIERGLQQPRLSTLLALARVLDASAHELIDLLEADNDRQGEEAR